MTTPPAAQTLCAQSLERLRGRAITHPAIAALRTAGYDVALCDEAEGVALTVKRGDERLVVRGAEGAVLAWVEQWLQSREMSDEKV